MTWILQTFIVAYLLINRTTNKASIPRPTISTNTFSINCDLHGTLDVYILNATGSHRTSSYSLPCLQFYKVAEINTVGSKVRNFKVLYI